MDVAKRLGISDKSLSRWKLASEKQILSPNKDDVAHLKLGFVIQHSYAYCISLSVALTH